MSVVVDPGSFSGFWWMCSPACSRYAGSAAVQLAPGRHQIRPTWETSFDIDVDSLGQVTPVNPATAVGGVGTLTFKTVPVLIDPGSLSGGWFYGGGPTRIGPWTEWLVPTGAGNYVISTSYADPPGVDNGVRVLLRTDGELVALNKPAAATVVGNSITLHTTEITFSPNAFGGSIRLWVPNVPIHSGGVEFSLHLIRDCDYWLNVGSTPIVFRVGADGNVSSGRPTSAVAIGSRLSFSNVPVDIQPQAYAGEWNLRDSSFGVWSQFGPKALVLVPDVTYSFDVGFTQFTFDVAASGDVTSVSRPASAVGEGNVLKLRNAQVTIDPGLYTGNQGGWGIEGVGNQQGVVQLALVPDVLYGLSFSNISWGVVGIGADGTWSSATPTSMIASGLGTDTLTISTVKIDVDPGSYADDWVLAGWVLRGRHQIDVVPGLDYWVSFAGFPRQKISVFSPCAVQPSHLVVGGATFSFNCQVAPPDADADGIPDASDNCVWVANADQIDLDGDGQGGRLRSRRRC